MNWKSGHILENAFGAIFFWEQIFNDEPHLVQGITLITNFCSLYIKRHLARAWWKLEILTYYLVNYTKM